MSQTLSTVSVNQPVITAEAAHKALEATVAHAKQLQRATGVKRVRQVDGLIGVGEYHDVEIARPRLETGQSSVLLNTSPAPRQAKLIRPVPK